MPRRDPCKECYDLKVTCYECYAQEAELDIFNTDDVWLFTLSINPRRFHSKDPREQYIQLLDNVIYPMVTECFSRFVLTPELNDANNVHIHGWFVLKDSIRWHRKWYPKLKVLAPAGCRMNRMKSKKALETYYKKDINEMNHIINGLDPDSELPVPLTHNNLEAYCAYKVKVDIARYMKVTKKDKKYKDIMSYFMKVV